MAPEIGVAKQRGLNFDAYDPATTAEAFLERLTGGKPVMAKERMEPLNLEARKDLLPSILVESKEPAYKTIGARIKGWPLRTSPADTEIIVYLARGEVKRVEDCDDSDFLTHSQPQDGLAEDTAILSDPTLPRHEVKQILRDL